MKKLFNIVLLVSTALVIFGCVATPSKNFKRSFAKIYHSPTVIDYPSIEELKTVELGESLVYKDKQTTIPAIDIDKPFEHYVENLGIKEKVTLLPGRYVESGNDAHGKYYLASSGKFLANEKPIKGECGVYVNDSDSMLTEIYCIAQSGAKGAPLTYIANGIPFTKSVHQTRDELSFRKELVYAGISQNMVSILYREFTNDMARPAYSQDLKYDLSESKTFGFRGSRFEIIKATNQGLTYKTLKETLQNPANR
jgi:hypothetical protein